MELPLATLAGFSACGGMLPGMELVLATVAGLSATIAGLFAIIVGLSACRGVLP